MKYIFIDIDDTVRNTTETLVKFAKDNFNDELESLEPFVFKSGKIYGDYYNNYPNEIIKIAPPIKNSQYFINKIKNELKLNVIYLSTQRLEYHRKVTENWLYYNKFIKSRDEVLFSNNMNKKDYMIGELKFSYKPLLVDDWNFENTFYFSKQLKFYNYTTKKGMTWVDITFNYILNYYNNI